MSDEIVQVGFDYGLLDEDKRVRNQVRAASIKARMKRTAEDIIAIGQDLIDAKKDLGHGLFLSWLKSEFEMSRQTADNFIHVAERFGSKMLNFSNLPISVLYALATPSTPDSVVSQVSSGEIPPTLNAIKEAKEAQRKAEQDRENAEKKAESTEQQLTLFSKLSQDKISELTGRITALQKQVKTISKPDSIEVIPQETLDQIARLEAQITELTQQKKLISDEAVKLSNDLREMRETTQLQRDQERYMAQIKSDWKKATDALFKALSQFTLQIPSPIAMQVFDADEWARYDQIEQALHHFQAAFTGMKTARYSDQFVESSVVGAID